MSENLVGKLVDAPLAAHSPELVYSVSSLT